MASHPQTSRKCIWLTIGVGLYIAGLVMSIIGFTDIFKALDEIYSSSTWGQFNDAFIAIVILFGVLQLSTLFLVLFMRSHSMLLLGCIDCQNPCARWQNVDQSAFVFQALYNGLLVIQINVTVCVFGVGLMLWAMRYVLGLGCTAVLSKLVLAQIFNDLCLNLSVIGLGEKAICGSDLVNVCNFWSNLRTQFLIWGSYCFLMSHLLFIGALVHNMFSLPTQSMQSTRAKEESIAVVQQYSRHHGDLLVSNPLSAGASINAGVPFNIGVHPPA